MFDGAKAYSFEKPPKLKEKLNTSYRWEYNHWFKSQDLLGCTNKSVPIYRLMHSKFETNLAKS